MAGELRATHKPPLTLALPSGWHDPLPGRSGGTWCGASALTSAKQAVDRIPAQSGERVSQRDSMMLQATVRRAEGVPASLRVRNLSGGGLMADRADALSQGEAVTVELRGIGSVGAEVVWIAAGRMGLAFVREVDTALARKPEPRSPGAGMTLLRPPAAKSRRPAMKPD